MNMWKHKARLIQGKNYMSEKTKDLLQKICYKKTASIDMTSTGFISDSKVHPVKLLIKPLKEQLEKIRGTYASTKEVNNVLPKLKQRNKAPPDNNGLEKRTLKTPRKRFGSSVKKKSTRATKRLSSVATVHKKKKEDYPRKNITK